MVANRSDAVEQVRRPAYTLGGGQHTGRKGTGRSAPGVTPAEIASSVTMARTSIPDHEHPAPWGCLPFTMQLIPITALHDPSEKAGKELQDTVDCVFMLGMPLPRLDSLFPKCIVRPLERIQVCGYNLLLMANGVDAFDDGTNIHRLSGKVTVLGSLEKTRSLFGKRVVGWMAFALDKGKQVGLAAVEVWVSELGYLIIMVHSEQALLESR